MPLVIRRNYLFSSSPGTVKIECEIKARDNMINHAIERLRSLSLFLCYLRLGQGVQAKQFFKGTAHQSLLKRVRDIPQPELNCRCKKFDEPLRNIRHIPYVSTNVSHPGL